MEWTWGLLDVQRREPGQEKGLGGWGTMHLTRVQRTLQISQESTEIWAGDTKSRALGMAQVWQNAL